MSIHSDHRARVRKRFLQEGLAGFDELHVLELMLFYCIPRKDTNELAHNLLKRFGTLPQVMEATVEELEKEPGIGENAAAFIKFTMELSRYYMVHREMNVKIMNTIEKCGQYLTNCFVGERDEAVYMMCLDGKCKMLCCKKVGSGSVNSAGVPIRRIVELALGVNATSVILSHNHPSGLAIPSSEDITTTRRLAAALDAVDIRLADHIIVADSEFVSLLQANLYHPDDCRMII